MSGLRNRSLSVPKQKLFVYLNLIRLFTTLSTRYSKQTIIVSVLLAILCLVHASGHLKFDTNQDNLISKDQKYFKDYTNFLKEFGDWEYIYLVISGDQLTVDDKRSLSNELTQLIQKRPDLFASITNKFDLSALEQGLLLLLPEERYQSTKIGLAQFPDVVQKLLDVDSPTAWFGFFNHLFDRVQDIDTSDQELMIALWPQLKEFLFLPFSENTPSAGPEKTNIISLMGQGFGDTEGYLSTPNQELYFVRVLPNKDYTHMEIISEPLKYLRACVADLNKRFPQAVGITGRPVLQNDEAASTQSDSQWAGLASFLLVALLFFVFFRGYKRSIFALLALMTGMLWTVGFVSLVYGALNLISIAFVIILIGLGIEYGIYFLMRYQEERLKGVPVDHAIFQTLMQTGSAIVCGAITAALAFGTAFFTKFDGLKQLGVIAGTGVVLCCLAELALFPALLHVFDQKTKRESYRTPSFAILHKLTARPKLILTLFVLLSLVCIPFALTTGFNDNLLDLQDPKLESVQLEKLIQEKSDFSTWFLADQTRDLAELRQLQTAVQKLKTVKRTESILDLIPSDQQKRITEIQTARRKAQWVFKSNFQAPEKSECDFECLKSANALNTRIGKLSNAAFSSGRVDETSELNEVKDNLDKLISRLTTRSEQKEIFNVKPIVRIQKKLEHVLQPQPITEEDLPVELLKTFKGPNGYYSLTIFPKEDIWNPTHLQDFIADVRRVIPNVTGAPITTHESARQMISGFILVFILTSILVFLIVFLEFRIWKISLFVFGNLILTLFWLLACMKIFGLQINLANFFALPILIGTGIDNGIHIVHRYRHTRSVADLYKTVIPAISLTCLTTIFGFASLAFVRHKGLASFGLIIAVGTALIWVSAAVVLPNLLRFRERKRATPPLPPS